MYGLVLEGGGAKGAYHIGAYKALMELGIEISAIAGTSIGAINGAMLVQGDFHKCYELWSDLNYSMLFDLKEKEIKKLENLSLDNKADREYIRSKTMEIISDGGIDTTGLKLLLDKYIDEDRFRKSKMDFGMVTVNLSEFKPLYMYKEDIPMGSLKDYLLASSSLPIFKTERLDGSHYLDGAFYDNLPFTMLEKRGYNKLILVRTHAMGITKRTNRSNDIIEIKPSEELGKSLDCNNDRANYTLELGYFDTIRQLSNFKGNYYTIDDGLDEDFYFDYIVKLSSEDIRSLEEILKLPKLSNKRSLFENIIPKIHTLLDLPKDYDYGDIIIGLIEVKAREANLDKFKVYRLGEILGILENRNILALDEDLSTLDKIIEKVDIFPIFNREKTLLNVANIIVRKR